MVASPSLTLTITPPGGSATNYTQYMAWSGSDQQLSITQNFGRQGDTAVIALVDDWGGSASPHVIIPVLSTVKLFDNIANVTLFAGVVTDPKLEITSPTRYEWQLNCVDYTFYADNAIVRGTFFGLTADQIIVALTQQAACGISAVPLSQGGFVAPAPQLASLVINWMKLSDAWRKLAQLSGSVTPFGWYVDEQLRLHFFDATTAINSGVTFTTAPTVGGSTTEGHITLDSQNLYEWDGTSIRNRILVQGATQTITSPTTGPATDTFVGDGVTLSWPLRYTLTGSPVLTVNGVAVSVTVVTAGGTPTGTWVAEQNTVGQWFLTTPTPPGTGVVLRIWYSYQIPVVAQANDAASQALYTGPNGGIYSEFISDNSLTTAPMALARAQRERTEYAFAAERANFDSTEDFLGWVRAGETCTINNQLVPDARNSYTLGVNGAFILISNQIQFGNGGYRNMQITAVRL